MEPFPPLPFAMVFHLLCVCDCVYCLALDAGVCMCFGVHIPENVRYWIIASGGQSTDESNSRNLWATIVGGIIFWLGQITLLENIFWIE